MRFSVLLCLLFICLHYKNVSFAQPVHATSDTIVAEVNGEKIYKSGIDTIIADFAKAGTVIDTKTKKTLIDKLIEQKLVAQFAQKQGYDKRPAVQKQIQVMTEMVLHDSYFSERIKQHITPQNIKAEFDKYSTDAGFRFDYKASHILVGSRTKAEQLKKQLNNHTELFAELAKKHSTDGTSKLGGDLGYFTPQMMVKPFVDCVEKLFVGEISDPVQTEFGWHLIHLTDKRTLPKPTLEQLTPKIENDLARRFITDHTNELKKQSKIKIYDF